MLNEIQNTLSPLLSDYSGYAGLIAFLAAFLETLIGVGYFLPGSTILLILGIFAGQGIVSLASIWLFAFAGAFGGDQFNYFLGRRYGDALLAKPWFHLPTELLGKTHLFFRRHGGISIFLGRFLPGIKEAIAFVAGSFGLRYRRFLFWEFFGALGWSIEFIGIGYLFSSSLSLAQIWLTRTGFVIVSLILFFLILYLLKRFIQHNAKPAWALLCSIGNSVKNNSDVKAWLKKYPKIVTFLKQRIDSSHFYGLPLTLLSLVFLYVLALFGGAVEDFINRAPIVAVDHIIANLTPPLRTPALTDFFTWVTLLGKTEVAGVFLLATALVLWLYAKSRYILSLILSVGGATVLMGLGKLAFHRPRPDVASYVEHTYSLPSGHATIAVALYGFVAYLLMHFSKNLKTKLNIFFAATILILLIGLSRIYLAEHYLSDVYTGFLVGTLWLIVAIAFT
ncbi:MAG TPA: phosphatase PAP2 family protein, partial [Epsilonproteobacteria bacterium]|nr:phosphatase PAP2 family protein [Campylobacterota bacterium]